MNNNITVKLRGGLGNQLFQYAYALHIQKLFPDKNVVLDTTYYMKKHIRNLDLNKLSITGCEWSNRRHIFFDLTYDLFRILNRLFRRESFIFFSFFTKSLFVYCDKAICYKHIGQRITNIYLAGYFQQEHELRDIREELVKIIVPKEPLSDSARYLLNLVRTAKSNNDRIIAVSIRAGEDYRRFGWPVCTKEFYQRGLDELYRKGNRVFVFSDEIDMVQSNEWFNKYENVIYVTGISAEEALYIMTQCEDFVIANSTFSWWGAYMADEKNKCIIAPKYFYPLVETCKSMIHIPTALYFDNFTGAKC